MIILFFPFIVLSQEDLFYYEQYMPESSCGEIINYSYYSVSFCEDYSSSEWAIYFLTNERQLGLVPRSSDFRQDPQLKGRDASVTAFIGSGYDRGHLVPAGDMSFNERAMSESYYMTNMSAQTASLNRGGWKELETKIREWSYEIGSVVIITGLIKTNINTYGSYNLPIPEYYYKVFIDVVNKSSLALIIPNKKIKKNLMEYAVSIEELESVTGLDFFYKLPDEIELMFEIDTGVKKIKDKK